MSGMEERTYHVPVTWRMYGVVAVTASSLDEAIKLALDPEEPLPEGNYEDGSEQVDYESLKMWEEEDA